MISMLREKRRIGFFGGTFDPFHRGHLAMAKAAAEALHLHHVSFVPTSQNPLKGNAPCATDRQRVEMIQLGIASNPLFGLWDGELERDGPSYTIDTVEQVHHVYPNSHLFWIIGTDQLEHLARWARIETLVYRVSFILLQRPGYEFQWPGIKGLTIYPVENKLVPVSSTEIREQIRQGDFPRGCLPREVGTYIRKSGLYRPESHAD
jgi:nicotinate-nucleotide adenylyltransferase